MSKEEIEYYNREINKFWKENDLSVDNSNSWEYLMMTYEELCKKLPFVPFTIVKNEVYQDGLIIANSFKEAMFVAIGTCCARYNNRTYHIVYE